LKYTVKEVKHRWILLAVVTVTGFFIDIGTKYLADTRLEYQTPVSVIGDYLQWLLVYNKGMVFGINPSDFAPWLSANTFFVAFMLCAIAFLLLYYKALKKDEVLMHVGLMLVLPGAFGNLYDRIFNADKGVIDFIRMGFPPDNYWFIYNVADIYVTVGVGVMLLGFWLEMGKKSESPESAKPVEPEQKAKT